MFRAGTTEKRGTGARILVVRIGSLGDVIHALPAVASLKHSFPGSVLSWVIHPRWLPLLEGNPYVDRVIPFDRRRLASVRAAWHLLHEQRYDFAVDLQGLLQSALVASFARPDRLFGFHHAQVREPLAAVFYSTKVRTNREHVVDRNLQLAQAAGASALLVTFPLPEGRPEGELPRGCFVLANPLTGWGAKQWPIENYGTLARRLRDELGMPLVLNGAPGAVENLAAGCALVHVSGIAGLIHATRRAAAVLGTDSGPTHLAAALGRPGVALFGPTDPRRNGPYGDSFAVLRSPGAVTSYRRRSEPDPGMRDITVEAVFEALKAKLAKEGRSAGCGSD